MGVLDIKTNARKIEIFAGPNGSGKTTFAESFLTNSDGNRVFLNPDKIAAGIAPHDFEHASFHAGRLLISEVRNRLAAKENFAFESTLSGKTWLNFLNEAVTCGYEISIYFIFLNSIERNLNRIKKRVSQGGHPIPDEAVFRRHPRCFSNFWNLYRPLCSEWHIFDNSGVKPKLVLSKNDFQSLSEKKANLFAKSFLKGRPRL